MRSGGRSPPRCARPATTAPSRSSTRTRSARARTASREPALPRRTPPPLAELPLTPELLTVLRKHHLRQFRARALLATVWDWVASGGGRPERVLERVRLAGTDPPPHVLCFGPALNRRFLSCFGRAHAVVPYRIEEGRVYVYDPNYPGDRERFVTFWRDGMSVEFAYGEFRSRAGWGITLSRLAQ